MSTYANNCRSTEVKVKPVDEDNYGPNNDVVVGSSQYDDDIVDASTNGGNKVVNLDNGCRETSGVASGDYMVAQNGVHMEASIAANYVCMVTDVARQYGVKRAENDVCMMTGVAKYDTSSLDDIQLVEEVHVSCQPYVIMEADDVASVYADQRGIDIVANGVNVADIVSSCVSMANHGAEYNLNSLEVVARVDVASPSVVKCGNVISKLADDIQESLRCNKMAEIDDVRMTDMVEYGVHTSCQHDVKLARVKNVVNGNHNSCQSDAKITIEAVVYGDPVDVGGVVKAIDVTTYGLPKVSSGTVASSKIPADVNIGDLTYGFTKLSSDGIADVKVSKVVKVGEMQHRETDVKSGLINSEPPMTATRVAGIDVVKEAVKKVVESVKSVKGDEGSLCTGYSGVMQQQQQQQRQAAPRCLKFNKIGHWTSDGDAEADATLSSKLRDLSVEVLILLIQAEGRVPAVILNCMKTVPYNKAKETAENYGIKTEVCADDRGLEDTLKYGNMYVKWSCHSRKKSRLAQIRKQCVAMRDIDRLADSQVDIPVAAGDVTVDADDPVVKSQVIDAEVIMFQQEDLEKTVFRNVHDLDRIFLFQINNIVIQVFEVSMQSMLLKSLTFCQKRCLSRFSTP